LRVRTSRILSPFWYTTNASRPNASAISATFTIVPAPDFLGFSTVASLLLTVPSVAGVDAPGSGQIDPLVEGTASLRGSASGWGTIRTVASIPSAGTSPAQAAVQEVRRRR